MTPFLKQIAEELLKLNHTELSNTLVIVPSRRAKVFILKYISETIESAIYTPEIISINDFVYKQSKLLEADPMDMLMLLYEVHREMEGNNAQSLDQFSTWADLLLSDFNDIDLYMVPVERLFSYLSDAKEMDIWHLDPEKLTEQEKNYLKFYSKLNIYYQQLNKKLLDNNTAYQGMAFRYLASADNYKNLNYKHIFIAGFNAFTLAEETIVKKLETEYSAKIFWDIDQYYFDNKSHEAGKSLRKLLGNKELSKVNYINDNWLSKAKSIDIYGVDGNVAQAKFAADLLKKQFAKDPQSINKTALVLASEDLLLPVLNSIPEEIKNINITMSYPLRLHGGTELINLIVNLYNDYKFEEDNKSELSIYYKHFENFILHPFIQQYLYVDKNIAKEIVAEINKLNIQRIDIDYLNDLALKSDELKKLIETILDINRDVRSSTDVILNVFGLLKKQESKIWELSFINHYIEILSNLSESLSIISYIEKLSTIKRWILNAINHSPIPFIGEPIAGLQIMGMLETRTLDFENIILLSVNEDILPKTQPYQSFILFDIKKEFGMPLPSDNDSITSYHFYRLLQRCDNVNLLYNSSTASMQSGEMSRYIKQIEIEIPKANSKIEINHRKVKFGFSANEKAKDIKIEKTDAIIDYLIEYSQKRYFSPSSLNNYKKCSYLFYLQKVLGIKVSDEVEEKMAYNTQGNLLHNSLEDYYQPYLDKELNLEEFSKTCNNIYTIFEQKLDGEYKNMNTKTGKNFLTRKILEQYISNFIKQEKTLLKSKKSIKIIGLEQDLAKTISLDVKGKNIDIRIGGSADRIDLVENTVRLIDYKTGAVNVADLKITKNKKDGSKDKWPLMFEDKLDKAFQLMMYAWMYWEEKPKVYGLETSISALKLHSANLPLSIYKETLISEESINRFGDDLKGLIGDIFDKNIAFEQRENDRTCENCDYKSICSR